MRNYDEIEEFVDYTATELWENYIVDLIGIWEQSYLLKEYFEVLKQEYDNLPFSSLREEEKPLFLGGIRLNREKIYPKNSLANFYKKFFGLKIKDIQSWMISQREEAPANIETEVLETDFMEFVDRIFKNIDTALQRQTLVTNYIEPNINYNELKREPSKVKQLVEKFYQQIFDTSVNYNYHTFFLWSLNQVARKFLESAYPRIEEILNLLKKEFGLTELKWNNPIKPDSPILRDYAIFCFPEYNPNEKGKSFGGSVCLLNETIWEMFYSFNLTDGEPLSFLFAQVPNLKKEFRERVETRIPENYHSWISYKGISASASSVFSEESNTSLMELLDENMPYLFLGLIKLSYISENSFRFDPI